MAGALKDQFVVGIVRGSHGITGEFKVESTSGEYEHFADMDEVTLTNGTVSRLMKIESVSEGSNILYMKIEGINSPEEAAKFNRWEIVVPREKAHKLQKDEWYIEDLKGCSIWYKETAGDTAPAFDENSIVGTVTNVLEGGSGYLVEILLSESCSFLSDDVKLTRKGNPKTVYVPFKDEFIGKVDVDNRQMQLMHLWILE
ncbi:MAG: ribosome maturation factor RimM [Spirochaetia bacterium]|uniref:ribosome maturation factor RimM n=1 Tax=Treponema sp. TaxID=166 RepID=UPI00298DDB36|nr:ribosome maturation factor RimM [Treponema sp.]MCI7397673.1 ribosome maturation factor RimM [Spirochaetia bacterium]MCI7578536.1 ribosome maturation factor RimM [Spirochaetia bacterium]